MVITAMFNARTQKGFSLIEVMVTVAIIAILATIAVPSYIEYVRQGKIAEATSNLADFRTRIEQYFQDNHTYVGYTDVTCTTANGRQIQAKYFSYKCVADATTFTITATGESNHRLANFEYTVDQDNKKTSKYDGTSNDACWITKKGGSC